MIEGAPSSSRRWARPAIGLFALGATLGVLLDHLHVSSGTTRYAGDTTPLWVVPLFGGAAMALGLTRVLLGRRLDGPRPTTLAMAIGATVTLIVAYGFSAYLPGPWALGLTIATATFALVIFDRSRAGAIAAALGASIGPLVEIGLIAVGAFRYVDAPGEGFVLGVPHWLPALYACAAITVGTIARRLARG